MVQPRASCTATDPASFPHTVCQRLRAGGVLVARYWLAALASDVTAVSDCSQLGGYPPAATLVTQQPVVSQHTADAQLPYTGAQRCRPAARGRARSASVSMSGRNRCTAKGLQLCDNCSWLLSFPDGTGTEPKTDPRRDAHA